MGKYETIERVDELFRLQEDGQLTEWQCPACADTCECAACWRKRHPNTGANIPKPVQHQQQQPPPQQPPQIQHIPQQINYQHQQTPTMSTMSTDTTNNIPPSI